MKVLLVAGALLWIQGLGLALILQAGQWYVDVSTKVLVWPLRKALRVGRDLAKQLWKLMADALGAVVGWVARWLFDRVRRW